MLGAGECLRSATIPERQNKSRNSSPSQTHEVQTSQRSETGWRLRDVTNSGRWLPKQVQRSGSVDIVFDMNKKHPDPGQGARSSFNMSTLFGRFTIALMKANNISSDRPGTQRSEPSSRLSIDGRLSRDRSVHVPTLDAVDQVPGLRTQQTANFFGQLA